MTSWRFDARHPADAQEMLDDPRLAEPDAWRALEDIAHSNRRLGGHRAILREVGDLIRVAAREGRGPVTLLDAGAGAGDVAIELARWARGRGLPLRILALDSSPASMRLAARAVGGDPSIEIVRGDALRLPFADGSIDVLHAGLLLHHVPRPDQAALLRRFANVARIGFVVTDLRRSRWSLIALAVHARVANAGPVFRHDAPLSVARGFTLSEARALAAATALRGLRVSRPAAGRVAWSLGPLPRREAQGRSPVASRET